MLYFNIPDFHRLQRKGVLKKQTIEFKTTFPRINVFASSSETNIFDRNYFINLKLINESIYFDLNKGIYGSVHYAF